jgi:hypothetical protein
MWSDEEGITRCPDCGVDVVALHELPPSAETVLEREAETEAIPEEFRRRSWRDLGRGRGWLIFFALLGLVGFFQPWFVLRKPEEFVLSGFRIARHFAGWVWAGAVAWFVLIPLVASRRTIASLRGVRAVCAFFASLTAGEILVLVNVSPTSKVHVPIEFGWCWGLFFSAAASVLATIVALNLGGALPRREDQKKKSLSLGIGPKSERAARGDKRETLH